MREDNLLCLRKKRFVATTNSDHSLPVYPNLAADMDITAPDQLWVSDLTYIRLGHEFVYLAVVLDACSRRCLGWALGRRLDAALATSALKMAYKTNANGHLGGGTVLQGVHRIVMLGDSIIQWGDGPTGYVGITRAYPTAIYPPNGIDIWRTTGHTDNFLAGDGVHKDDLGNRFMSATVLTALLSPASKTVTLHAP